MARAVRITKAVAKAAETEIDWARIDAMDDAEVARQVADNPDAAPILSDQDSASARVRAVRHRLGLTQPDFARRFHIPVATLRDWEQGRRMPEAASLAYLRVIERAPAAVADALKR